MSISNKTRRGGLAAIAAGLLYIVGWPGAAEILPVVSHVAGHALFALAGLFSLLALVGVVARDAGHSGMIGRIGYVVCAIGSVLIFIGNGVEAVFEHQFSSITGPTYAFGWLGVVVGLVLLGIGAWRAKILPRWSALTLIIAPLGFFVMFAVGTAMLMSGEATPQTLAANVPLTVLAYTLAVVFGIPWLALGYALWSGAGETARQRQPLGVEL